jgi:hypothetical protein
MNKVLYIFIILIFVSCDFISKKDKFKKYEFIDVVIVQKNVKGIDNLSFEADKNKLVGSWIEKIVWENTGDSVRTGIRSLGPFHEYIFFKEHMFYYKTFNKDSSIRHFHKGVYYLSKDHAKLCLCINDKNDSVFKKGDTVNMIEKRIHLLNDSIIRLEEYYSANSKFDIVEYKKEK